MNRLILTLGFLFLIVPCAIYAADRPLDVGVAMSADPLVHEAVYAVLKSKNISCSGLSTRKDGTVTILNSSSDNPIITVAEIQAEINKLVAEQDIEKLIQDEIRALSIQSLKDKGKIPHNWKDKKEK